MRSRMFGFVLTGVALGVAMFTPRSWGQVAEHPVLLALSKTDHTLDRKSTRLNSSHRR